MSSTKTVNSIGIPKQHPLVVVRAILVCFCFLGLCETLVAFQGEAPQSNEEKIRAEIDLLRDHIVKAHEDRDLESLVEDFAPNAIVTWQNTERNRGSEEFRALYERMLKGDDAVIKNVETKFEIDGEVELYGEQLAIVCGSIEEEFQLQNGKEFKLDSKWTASLTKTESGWKIASYHVSADMFDNPVMAVARFNLVMFAIAGALLGFILGCAITWFIIRSTQKQIAADAI
jgi:ketosteroid isomerase-like protein